MGEGEALHSGEDGLLQFGILGFQGGNEGFDLLALGVAVGGAGVVDHRELEAGNRLPDHGLADIEKGADLGDVRAVQIGYGVEAGQAALIKQGEEEGLHCVVIVVAQGDLVNARLQQGGVEGAPAHFGAEGAGIFLPPGLKDHMVHLGGNPVEGDAQLPAVVRQRRQVHARGPHVHRKGLHGKAPRIKLCQPGQGGQQHQGVLPPGYPHGHPLPGGDHIIVLHTPTEKTENLLHDGYTPCAQK